MLTTPLTLDSFATTAEKIAFCRAQQEYWENVQVQLQCVEEIETRPLFPLATALGKVDAAIAKTITADMVSAHLLPEAPFERKE